MIVPLDLILLFFLISAAICISVVRDLLSAIVIFGAYGFIMANVWLQLNAPDIAFTEAAVGAGVVPAMMIATLSRLKSRKEKKVRKKLQSVVGFLTVLILFLIFAYAISDAPAFGDANSPANRYIMIFRVEMNENYVEMLNSGVVPIEIKEKIEKMFNKSDNFPELEDYLVLQTKDGWDVLIKTHELYYHEPIKLYFIKKTGEVYRYNWPVRVLEKTVEETGIYNAVTSGLADYRGYDTMFEEIVIFTAAVCVILLVRKRGVL
ncbi:MAG: DUF4040 domain-containing protein [Archaeoglobaceae archaeon]|nr:DUF4040 domain-containing protein [Archaeoglobaceae archaeon]MCX8152765.1 DUF4040 domain-containing protein [Archaeoglobaceae archaeon]MDW8013472.1 DUF4040 domain-containing protein [Archaeoglobaceae archaeon]